MSADDPHCATPDVLAQLPFPTQPLPTPEAIARTGARHHHLIIACAAMADDAACQQALHDLALPALDGLLRRLPHQHTDTATEDSPIPPHERAAARALGLDAACPPWAALAAITAVTATPTDSSEAAPPAPPKDEPVAWLTPCHWLIGADQVRMDDPLHLGLDAPAARALHAVLAPWFAQDGLHLALDAADPLRWRVHGRALAGLQCASLDRAALRDLRPWMPSPRTAATIHRLHSEVQMLLYTHPFNDAREVAGLPPVNAFWLHSCAALPVQRSTPDGLPAVLHAVPDLRPLALRQQWAPWRRAWQQTDAGPLAEFAALLPHIAAAGGRATLTLCGERAACSFSTHALHGPGYEPTGADADTARHDGPSPQTHSLWLRLQRWLRPVRFASLHQKL